MIKTVEKGYERSLSFDMGEIVSSLNIPLKQDERDNYARYKTMSKDLLYEDKTTFVLSFIAWLRRMTNEEVIAFDIQKNGKFYTAQYNLHQDITPAELEEQVNKALSSQPTTEASSHYVVTDRLLADNEVVLQLVLDIDKYYMEGVQAVINDRYEQRYLTSYAFLTNDLHNHKEKPILDLDLLTPEELVLWEKVNATEVMRPKGETLHGIFTATAKKYPNNTAIKTDNGRITFADLDKASNGLAQDLLTKGVATGDYVAVYMDRSIEAIVGMLGVMKAGGVYVSLSPDNPKDRNAYIMEDADIKVILTVKEHLESLESFAPKNTSVVDIHSIEGKDETPITNVSSADIAYIIYTSGSTGKPKGVKIPHKSVITFGYSELDIYKVTSDDILTQFYTLTFDASILELCPMIFTGAQLYMLTREERLDVSLFSEAIKREGVTHALLIPMSALKQFTLYASEEDAEAISKLKCVGVGAEALTGETARLFQKRFGYVPLINMYGPTECSVATTSYTVDTEVPLYQVNVPIGKPLNNYKIHIVNERDQLCPIGVAGELLIETEGIADGYLNLPDKTNEVFVRTDLTSNLVYRSGDLVKLLEDGNVEFLGRKDSQVKIRGYRIELGEIEDKLLKLDGIENGVVVAKDVNGDKVLAAYYTKKEGTTKTQKDVLTSLASMLPKYMVPTYVIELEEFPFLPSGKVNRKELTSAPLEVSKEAEEDKKAPSNAVEEKFLSVWKEVLGLNQIGVDENFFEIGGHSLKVLSILTKLKKDYPVLKINDFFTHPTIESLSHKVLAGDIEEKVEQGVNVTATDLEEHPKQLVTKTDIQLAPQTDVLLTGATGHLGANVLIDLIKYTDMTIYTLVRANTEQEGLYRIIDKLEHYASKSFFEDYHVKDRIVVVLGDFTKENLGLSMEGRTIVEIKVNAIIHCGADVRHFGDKEEFTKANVDSTRYLLNLAASLSNCRFHYISTIGIPEELALEGYWDDFLKASSLSEAPELTNLYTNSKLESEKLVEEYYQKGLPVTILRPGNISCQYETGVFQHNINANAIYRMLKSFILLGKAPDVDFNMDFTMVDFASRCITEVIKEDTSVGGVYHICNPTNIPFHEVINHVRSYGYKIEIVSNEEYESFLYSDEPKDPEGLELAMAGLEGDGAKESPLTYCCPRTMEVLSKKGIHTPNPDKAFIHRMIEQAIKVGYFPKP